MSLKFTQTYSIAASGTQTITTTEWPHIYLTEEFHIAVSGTGTVDVKTKQGTDTTQITQATVIGGSPGIIADLVNVTEISFVETAGNAVTVTLSGI